MATSPFTNPRRTSSSLGAFRDNGGWWVHIPDPNAGPVATPVDAGATFQANVSHPPPSPVGVYGDMGVGYPAPVPPGFSASGGVGVTLPSFGVHGHFGMPMPPTMPSPMYAPMPSYPPPPVYTPPQPVMYQPPPMTVPYVQPGEVGDNPFKHAVEARSAMTANWATRVMLTTGGISFMVILIYAGYYFYEWWGGRLGVDKPTMPVPGFHVGAEIDVNLYPGLPTAYASVGGWGFFVSDEHQRVYVAFDANATQITRANSTAAFKGYSTMIVMPGGGSGGTPANLIVVNREALLAALNSAKSEADGLRSDVDGRFRFRFVEEEFTSMKRRSDTLSTAIDNAIGTVQGGAPK